MKKYSFSILSLVLTLSTSISLFSQNILVSNQTQFDTALTNIGLNDTIFWMSGTYQNIHMDINKSNVVITCQELGTTIFSGASRVTIDADNVTLRGFQFIGGDIGTNHVIDTRGNNNNFYHLNIQDYISYKYLIIDEKSQFNKVIYCNFENRINLDDQNIVSILVDEAQPGYHVIQYCSFKNFDGTGNDMGIEPIRIGVSTQAEFISRSTVEYCYFTQCNGDGELISSKATQNVYRYNTFENNPRAELVLRHGSQNIVYGNFFLNGMGGVRIREGQNHVIFNNYFSGLTSRSLFVQNGGDDPVGNITVAYNTFVDSEEIRLSESGSDKPTNIIFANNIFTSPVNDLFDDASGNEIWLGNIYNGSLGINPVPGLSSEDPQLELNSEGYYGLSDGSPAIDASAPGFPAIPQYENLDIDNTISLDLMKQDRPMDIASKDIGCSEFPLNIIIQPQATEENTGPIYLQNSEDQSNLKVNVLGDGEVSLNPPSEFYSNGTVVTITAIPGPGAVFIGWDIDLSGNTNPQTIVMDSDKEITATFTMDQVTSLESELNLQGIRLYPNPVEDQFDLTLDNDQQSFIKVDLLSLLGKKIRTLINQSVQNSDFTLSQDVSDLQAGVYMLRISYREKNGSTDSERLVRFVKQ